jgi:hypothetical protein
MARGRSLVAVDFDSDVPEIAYVSDVARWLRTTPKAVRDRVRRDQLPRPGRVGKRLAWSRALLLDWARECGRAAGTPRMSITLRPYIKDKTRYHVDMQIEHPTTQLPCASASPRPRASTSARRSVGARRSWRSGSRRSRCRTRDRRTTRIRPRPECTARKCELTLEGFYRERFEPNYVRFSARDSDGYDTVWRNHLSALGTMPLRAIDVDGSTSSRPTSPDKGLGATSINLILKKLAKMLRWALHRRSSPGSRSSSSSR